MMVREFLAAEFEQRKDRVGPIRFKCMGPSPAWVNCTVRPGSEEQWLLVEARHYPQRGYDSVRFSVLCAPERDVEGEVAAGYETVKDEIVQQLGIFYGLVSNRLELDLGAALIREDLGDLLAHQETKGIGAWAWRLRHAGKRSLLLNLALIEHTDAVDEMRRHASERLAEVAAIGDVEAIRFLAENELRSSRTLDVKAAHEMVPLLQTAHDRAFQAVTVFAASVGGGVVGAALTAVATRASGS